MTKKESLLWLAGGLDLARVHAPAEKVIPWILATLGERLALPPSGVIADVGAILHGEGAHAKARTTGDARIDAAIRKYEDVFLGPLARDRRTWDACDAIAKAPAELRAEGVGIFTARILARIGYETGIALKPGSVRALAKEQVTGALRDEATRKTLAEGYEQLAKGARQVKELVTSADVFVLENLTLLRKMEQRVAIEQVLEARDAIRAAMPRRLKAPKKSHGTQAMPRDDDSEFPAGGFSSMATSGSIENVVATELVYMEKDAEIDPFLVRWAEGELLYWTRDEAIFLRPRRVIAFVFPAELTNARVKDRELPWQRVVLLMGTMLAIMKKLEHELESSGLQFVCVFPKTRTRSPLSSERELLELVLREEREKGLVEIVETTWEETRDKLEAKRASALVHIVSFGPLEEAIVHELGLRAPADIEAWTKGATDLATALLAQ